ncbi:MAG: diaminopimelate decarboxylase [Candidatus Lokiarchaeota archaeon]|nr:diaminopimelate decarboxylase [Candidatus Lokiarchaeota archaeon]
MIIEASVLKTLSDDLLINLAEVYGTPLYVYDGDLIVKRYKELFDFIKWSNLRIYYAMKANYNIAILRLLKEHDAYLDTVSPAEVKLALKLEYSPDHLLFTANNLTEEEMEEVQATGVLFNIGSLSRLRKYAKKYPNSKVCLRFNPDVVAGAHEKIQTGGNLTKFGILMQDVPKVKAIVKEFGLKVIGLHEHTGSGIKNTDKVFQSMKNLLSIAKKEDFPDLKFVDFGGGFKVPYNPTEQRIDYLKFGKGITQIFSAFCEEYGKELYMCFEPGKYIVAESGYLIVQVNTLKNNRGRLIAGTNSGFPQLIRPMFYNAYHHVLNLSNPYGDPKRYDLCGNICETGDRFAEDREIPELREGDYLAIQNAGAYCYSMGGIYNLRSMPSEILIADGKPKLVRKRMSNEELVDYIIDVSE